MARGPCVLDGVAGLGCCLLARSMASVICKRMFTRISTLHQYT